MESQTNRQIWLLLWFLCISAHASAKHVTCVVNVVNANAQPVAGAEVAIYEEFRDYCGRKDYAKLLGKIKHTDANGCCVQNADIEFQYNVFIVARKKGLALGWDCLDWRVIEQATANFNIILEPPCILAGTVVDEAGTPVARAEVHAVPETSYLPRLEQRPILAPAGWFTTQTDAKGNFRFENFAADVNAEFWVAAPGRSLVYKYPANPWATYRFEAGRTDIRLVLPREVQVRGRVVDAENGSAVADAYVLIHPDYVKDQTDSYCPKLNTTEQDGQFYFKGIPPGRHFISISVRQEATELVDKRVKFEIQADQDSKEITVALDKGGLIDMIVREKEANKPVSNLPIYFWQAIQDEHSSFYKYARTGNDGAIRVWTPPGECGLRVRRHSGRLTQTYRDQVIVAKAQTTKLEILLDSYPSVSGRVLDEAGQPVSEVLVEDALTDKAGKFETIFDPCFPPETLIARHTRRNLAAIAEVKNACKPIQITLKPALSITGKATDPDGVGIPATRLALWISSPKNTRFPYGSEIMTDSQGRYDMRAVVPEQAGFEYRIVANKSGYGNKRNQRISITGAPGTEVEMKTLVLQPANKSISGVVTTADGEPAAGVPILVRGNDQPIRNTITDSNGRFNVNRVCKGPLRIQANFDGRRGGSGVLRAEGGDQNLKIILGQNRVHAKQVSLIGTKLPNLKDLGIDLPQSDIETKVILICFFDMNQRTSRHLMRQLARQSEQLQEEGVTVLAVQGAKLVKDTFNKWIKENDIRFSGGMIMDDTGKTLSTWGVKALPWLILTNRQHLVTAEGFALDELAAQRKKLE